MAEKKLDKKDEKVVYWWIKLRDVRKVAERVRLSKAETDRILDRIEVQDEIERQENVLITERMKIQANAEGVTNELLEQVHLKLLALDPETHAEVLRRTMIDGYIITGRIESGNTRTLDAKEGPDAKPNFYQALVSGNLNVTVNPILPEAHKDHHFPIAPPPAKLTEGVRKLNTREPETVTGTVSSQKPKTSKVTVW